mmetsp:Transcript_9989/g.28377  ORF Transcript_9989/g.28377 Transcript_9989/m.28377 type:complete len:204 (+) Transcript_9989:1228-1839(+)
MIGIERGGALLSRPCGSSVLRRRRGTERSFEEGLVIVKSFENATEVTKQLQGRRGGRRRCGGFGWIRCVTAAAGTASAGENNDHGHDDRDGTQAKDAANAAQQSAAFQVIHFFLLPFAHHGIDFQRLHSGVRHEGLNTSVFNGTTSRSAAVHDRRRFSWRPFLAWLDVTAADRRQTAALRFHHGMVITCRRLIWQIAVGGNIG